MSLIFFNQDPLENFFGKVRQKGKRYVNPTCEAFTPYFKSLLVNNLSGNHSIGANCKDDELIDQENNDEEESHLGPFTALPEALLRGNNSRKMEKQSLNYVMEYILKTLLKDKRIKYCETCRHAVIASDEEKNSLENEFIRAKEYDNIKYRLQYVNENSDTSKKNRNPLNSKLIIWSATKIELAEIQKAASMEDHQLKLKHLQPPEENFDFEPIISPERTLDQGNDNLDSEEDQDLEIAIQEGLKETSPPTLKSILEELSSNILQDSCTILNITRSELFIGAIRAMSRKSFNHRKIPSVMFTDDFGESEGAIDSGGPRREFFRLVLKELQDSILFEGVLTFVTLHRKLPAIQQMVESLRTLDIYDKMQKHPDISEEAFCYKEMKLTSRAFNDMIFFDLSETGSNKREIENKTLYGHVLGALDVNDEYFKSLIPSYGDRIAIKTYSSKGNFDKKQILLTRLKHKFNRKKYPASDIEENENPRKAPNAMKNTRKIEMGWIHYENGRFQQVRTASGGGTRKMTALKTDKKADLLKAAVDIFFSDGKSPKGKLFEFQDMFKLFKMPNMRFYLSTSRIPSTVTSSSVCENTSESDNFQSSYNPRSDDNINENSSSAMYQSSERIYSQDVNDDCFIEGNHECHDIEITDHIGVPPDKNFDSEPIISPERTLDQGNDNLDSEEDQDLEIAIQESLKETSPPTLKSILEELFSNILQDSCTILDITRSELFIGAIRAMSRKSFHHRKIPSVMFTDDFGESEGAIDSGGPRREFFRLVLKELQDSILFEGVITFVTLHRKLPAIQQMVEGLRTLDIYDKMKKHPDIFEEHSVTKK
ncbi:unnamed protein product [Phaedon cochleariae]|uniref:HECT domain-containing protein n=1 Tax=Phaedon cochleariae TaxID=80249 RepID=A0A9N9SGQ2_PHACE|nr:unnamed protein product [Phaedon cochleariae]